MIVHEPVEQVNGDRVRLSAFIEIERRPKLSGTLWFEFPSEYAGRLSGQSSPFIAAMLQTAMVLSEDLKAGAAASPRFTQGMSRYQEIFSGWYPRAFRKVRLDCPTEAESGPKFAAPRVPGSAFSGGIDSFYTLISHLPGRDQAGGEIGYLLFVHGLDIPLKDRQTYATALAAYRELAGESGVTLIPAATNFRDLPWAGAVTWENAYGAVLLSLSLALTPVLSRFYLPANQKETFAYVGGSHPSVDPLFSTETLEVVHDGAASRLEKTAVVAAWPRSSGRLRVCWSKPDGLNNCGRCHKCVRTVLALDLLGVLSKHGNFSGAPEPDVRNWQLKNGHEIFFAEELRRAAADKGRDRLAADLEHAIRRCRRLQSVADVVVGILGRRGRRGEEYVRKLVFGSFGRLIG